MLAAAAAVASGGSSPSREVQEILSPKDSDLINDFFDDSTDLSDDNDVDSVPGKKNLGDQYNFDKPNSECPNTIIWSDQYAQIPVRPSVRPPGKEPHDTKASLNKGGAWPKVPQVLPSHGSSMSNMHCASFNNISASSTAAAATAAAVAHDSAAIAELGNKMDQMLECMQAQACQIAELRNAAEAERKRADEAHAQHLQQMEKRLAKVYEEHLFRAKREHGQRMEEYKKQQ